MGLESATYVSGLTTSWPLGTDLKTQGDDHIRLIKATLRATFPNASLPFYFPSATAKATTFSIAATDQNAIFPVDTSGGAVDATLPSLSAGDAGWSCEVVKTTTDANGVLVAPASGSIYSKVGATAKIRVGQYMEPARFLWTGTVWICSKPGTVGEVVSFDGALPVGFLEQDGTTYSSTSYPELYAYLGTTTLADKKGRTEVGVDAASAVIPSATTVGATTGAKEKTLLTANLPPYTPSGSIAMSGSQSFNAVTSVTPAYFGGSPYDSQPNSPSSITINGSSFTATFTGTAQGGTSTAFSIVQPSIAVRKAIRAC